MQKAPISALLLSNDAQTLFIMQRIFSKHEISADIYRTAPAAMAALQPGRFGLQALDLEEEASMEVLGLLTGDDPAEVIAFSGDSARLQQAWKKRTHFVLRKPFTPDMMAKAVRAAHSLLIGRARPLKREAPQKLPAQIKISSISWDTATQESERPATTPEKSDDLVA